MEITHRPYRDQLSKLPSSFEALESLESRQDWGKELKIGEDLGRELDLYRAITAFKRARSLAPKAAREQRMQIEYDIVFAYYMGHKFESVIDTFERSSLINVTDAFPAYRNLLIILYDSYIRTCHEDKAYRVLGLLKSDYPDTARDLELSIALSHGDLIESERLAKEHPSREYLTSMLNDFECQALDVERAGLLNAILPGAGYWYVGQRKTAFTSFAVNALFIYATFNLFENGHEALGAIMLSLEAGWYIGGIQGAGLAAQQHNDKVYCDHAREMLYNEKLYPSLMFQKAF